MSRLLAEEAIRDKREEVSREDVDARLSWGVDVPCRVCSEVFTLWFNGGELDARECCGYGYALQSRGTDLVVYGPSPSED